MAIIGRFIGVDKYQDSGIRDLPGAKRDALALWALFSDTLPDENITLLNDSEATVENIQLALQQTLTSATENDSVIFYFAGHGTTDHRLIAYNSSQDNWNDSTITVEELSTLFKKSKARSVLCILDCCFSGGITGRVFENAPIPRSIDSSLKVFAGEGQVFIAASDFNQYSYEIPTIGHGLFTKALLDTLTSQNESVDIQVIASQVMELVRAEASKLGLSQTPVLYGQIKGGLQLPKLSKGTKYAQHFPELSNIVIGKKIQDIAAFKIPKDILNVWATRLKAGLNDLQVEAINKHRILDNSSLMVIAPTSSGKTFIGEIAAAKAISDERKVVFLLPYKALVNEKYDYFTELYSTQLGMRVVRCTGDYSDQAALFIQGKYDIALLTYEMFLNLSVALKHVLNSIGLVVIDEAQFITDPNRGITVELLLTHLITAKERGIKPQLITLSATVGNINHFDEWLDLKVLRTDSRPVPLTEGVLDRYGMLEYKTPDGQHLTKQLLPSNSIYIRKQKASSQDVIVPLVKHLLGKNKNEKIILFRNKRGSAAGSAKYLASELGLPRATNEVAQLPNFDLTKISNDLRTCLNGGTVFHSTDLNREERALVERFFRSDNQNIKVLASTTTVAAGINTPASTVILAEHSFPGKISQPYTVAEYKNMVGRAGRLGFKEEGHSIMLAETPHERNQLFNKYVLGTPEAITSSFSEDNLSTWLLRLLAQINNISRTDVVRLLTNTFGGYLRNRQNPSWHNTVKGKLETMLNTLISHKLVEEERGNVRLTLLGIACGQSTLNFNSIIRLIDLIKQHGKQVDTIEDLMVLTQALPELDSRYIPIAKYETHWTSTGNTNTTYLLRYYTEDATTHTARLKRVSILNAWINGTPIEQIVNLHSTNAFFAVRPGDITGLADFTRYNLRSVYQIAIILLGGKCPDDKSLELFLRQLEFGIPTNALGLLSLPVLLERGEYLMLLQNGITTNEEYYLRKKTDVKKLLGDKADMIEAFKIKAPSLQ